MVFRLYLTYAKRPQEELEAVTRAVQSRNLARGTTLAEAPTESPSFFWTAAENERFIALFHTYGRSWVSIQKDMPGRTTLQCRTHGQKYIIGLGKLKSLAEEAIGILEDGRYVGTEFFKQLNKYQKERRAVLRQFPLLSQTAQIQRA